MKSAWLVLFLCFAAFLAAAQQDGNTKNSPATRMVRCGALIQPESGQVQHNVLVVIQGERIQEVRPNAAAPAGAQVTDLSDHTCLPGTD